MTIYHVHHIVPIHAGGTDDPSNLVKLTVPEHAEAHKKLWEDHGRLGDYLAWKCLSGQIGKEEYIKLRGKLSRELNPVDRRGTKAPMYGKKHKPETIEKIKRWRPTEEQRRKIGRPGQGRRQSEETKEKIRIKALGRKHTAATKEKLRSIPRDSLGHYVKL